MLYPRIASQVFPVQPFYLTKEEETKAQERSSDQNNMTNNKQACCITNLLRSQWSSPTPAFLLVRNHGLLEGGT